MAAYTNGEDRLRAKIEIDKRSGCWNWTGKDNGDGYGKIWIDGKQRYAHRTSYEVHCGAIPKGIQVCHHCDNRKCINPTHLFLGTNTQNSADRDAKGRQARGSQMGNAKLTEADIIAIRNASDITQGKLAKVYGVGQKHISYIRSGKVWAHVK